MHSLIAPFILIVSGGLLAAATPVTFFEQACERAGLQTGLAVHLGAEDLDTAHALVENGAAHVLIVTDDPSTGNRLRDRLADSDQLGAIQVLDRV